MTLLDRYLIRELFSSFLGIAAVLLFFVLANRGVGLLQEAAVGELPIGIILLLLFLKGISYLSLLLPIAFYLAVLMTLSRLSRDGELTAWLSCGVSLQRLAKPILMTAFALMLMLAYMSLILAPSMAGKAYELEHEAKRGLDASQILPGQFHQFAKGAWTLYVESVDTQAHRLNHLFIRYYDTQGHESLLTGDWADLFHDSLEQKHYMALTDGYRYESMAGSAQYQRVHFKHHTLLLAQSGHESVRYKLDAIPTQTLLSASEPKQQAELAWRLTAPMTIFFLPLFGLLVIRLQAKVSRWGFLFKGIIVYLLYYNLLTFGRVALEKAWFSQWVGLWWTHAVLLLFILWWMDRSTQSLWQR